MEYDVHRELRPLRRHRRLRESLGDLLGDSHPRRVSPGSIVDGFPRTSIVSLIELMSSPDGLRLTYASLNRTARYARALELSSVSTQAWFGNSALKCFHWCLMIAPEIDERRRSRSPASLELPCPGRSYSSALCFAAVFWTVPGSRLSTSSHRTGPANTRSTRRSRTGSQRCRRSGRPSLPSPLPRSRAEASALAWCRRRRPRRHFHRLRHPRRLHRPLRLGLRRVAGGPATHPSRARGSR